MQARMSRKSQPSEANRRLNAKLDRQEKANQKGDPKLDGSSSFVFGYGKDNRDMASRSAPKKATWETDGTVRKGNSSKFAVLAEEQSEEV